MLRYRAKVLVAHNLESTSKLMGMEKAVQKIMTRKTFRLNWIGKKTLKLHTVRELQLLVVIVNNKFC